MTAIEVRHLSKSFGKVRAVDDVSFKVDRGEIVGLLGSNGAGKTTAMRMILGLLRPTSGQVEIEGTDAARVPRTRIGYVPQGLGLYPDLTVEENVAFSAAAFKVGMPSLEAAGLAGVSDRRVADVSLGVRRRLAFLAAVSHSPSVLVLDEPTSGVGPLGRARLWEQMRTAADGGTALLVSTHHMEEAEECDRVVLMAAGRIVAVGSVADVTSGLTSVAFSGVVTPHLIEEVRRQGGFIVVDGSEWRVVGLGLEAVTRLIGPSTDAREVPATFEEAFVSLSS